ncbi:MAG TPA: polymer-forming cytoskeletal protein [Burkholderiaceae bacterium]|nr:polymer-forming cytoskeletal protein [Burkholderiaceae bacterium]
MSIVQFTSIAAFTLIAAALLVGPFVPALLEWLRPTDTGPLVVAREYDGDIRYFARTFERICRDGAGLALAEVQRERRNDMLATLGRDTFRLLGEPASWMATLAAAGASVEGLIAATDLELPAGVSIEREVLAYGALSIGSDSVVRSAMAIGDLALSPGATVLRWADAGGSLALADGARVLGRATASTEIRLGHGNEFQRAHAPRIVVGTAPAPVAIERVTEVAIEGTPLDRDARFVRVEGDLTIAPRSRVACNLVVTGDLSVGALAQIDGSIKAHGRVRIGRGARVWGAIASVKPLVLDPGAQARGPLLSEEQVELLCGARAGDEDAPTTVSADRIVLEEGAVVCGTLWARRRGETRAASANPA